MYAAYLLLFLGACTCPNASHCKEGKPADSAKVEKYYRLWVCLYRNEEIMPRCSAIGRNIIPTTNFVDSLLISPIICRSKEDSVRLSKGEVVCKNGMVRITVAGTMDWVSHGGSDGGVSYLADFRFTRTLSVTKPRETVMLRRSNGEKLSWVVLELEGPIEH